MSHREGIGSGVDLTSELESRGSLFRTHVAEVHFCQRNIAIVVTVLEMLILVLFLVGTIGGLSNGRGGHGEDCMCGVCGGCGEESGVESRLYVVSQLRLDLRAKFPAYRYREWGK